MSILTRVQNARQAPISTSLKLMIGAAGNMLATAVSMVLLNITSILMVRLLGVEGRGMVASAILLPTAISYGTWIGLPVACAYFAKISGHDRNAVIGTARTLAVGISVIQMVIATAAIFVFQDSATVRTASLVFLLFLPMNIFYSIHQLVLQADLRIAVVNKIRLIGTLVYFVFVCALYIFDIESVLLVTVAQLAGALVWTVLYWRVATSRPVFSFDRSVSRNLLGYGARAQLGSTSPLETLRLDQLILALFLSAHDLGLYVIAMTFITANRLIGISVGNIAFPVAIETAKIRVHITKQLKLLLFVTIVIATSIAAFEIYYGRQILELFFGSDAGSAYSALRVLVIASIFLNFRQVLADIMRGFGFPGIPTVTEVVSAVVLAVAAYSFWARGLDGVAIAVLISAVCATTVTLALYYLRATRPRVQIWSEHVGETKWIPGIWGGLFSRSSGVVLGVVLGTAGISYLITKWSNISRESFFLFFGIILVATPFVFGKVTNRFDIFEPVYLFSASFLVMFVLRPMYDLSQDGLPILLGLPTAPMYSKALFVALVGGCGFLIGYYSGFGKWFAQKLPIPSSEVSNRGAVVFALGWSGFCLILFLAFLMASGGPAMLLSILSGRNSERLSAVTSSSAYLYTAPIWISSVAILLLALTPNWRSKQALLGFTLALLSQIGNLGSGNRSYILPVAASIAILWYLRRNRRPSLLLLTLALSLTFSFGITLPRQLRFNESRTTPTSSVVINSITDPSDSINQFLGGYDTAMVGLFSQELSVVPSVVPYQLGRSYLEALTRPIPRSLWPGKPRSGDEMVMSTLWPSYWEQGIQFYFSIFGEPYLNFGLVGVAVFSFLFAICWRTLYFWFRRSVTNPVTMTLYALNWPFLFVYMRGGVGVDYQRQVLGVLPAILCLAFCATFFKSGDSKSLSAHTSRKPPSVISTPATLVLAEKSRG